MVERLVRNEKVWGSNPHTSTNPAIAGSNDIGGDENWFDCQARKRRSWSEAKLAELAAGEIIPYLHQSRGSGIK